MRDPRATITERMRSKSAMIFVFFPVMLWGPLRCAAQAAVGSWAAIPWVQLLEVHVDAVLAGRLED